MTTDPIRDKPLTSNEEAHILLSFETPFWRQFMAEALEAEDDD